ncbi:phosphoglycerate mutase-like protein [Athelia psychrophila]|uniref:Phosphoglycerate mutase-like protein n=1 Tax=Athelia psychrophila TaxID=1759441 RepID=A0A167UM23_9AGAM|nr:phosphoglycerate mutase-like protein [Fibularhizoctonia sp. CBS 109695]
MAPHTPDVELGPKEDFDGDYERETLLKSEEQPQEPEEQLSVKKKATGRQYALRHVVMSFLYGGVAVALAQYALRPDCLPFSLFQSKSLSNADLVALGQAGSTEVHNFPPAAPTNAFPAFFPTNIGFAGPTPTGAEPALVVTAPLQPLHTGAAHLVVPAAPLQTGSGDKDKGGKGKKEIFNMLKLWGNLSPWYSIARGAFGVDSGPEAPATCRVTGLHLLHRHGARYPTARAAYGNPAQFSSRLHDQDWETSGDLEFMNDWTYKLGEEVLTPFGRQQLFDLGISMRMKYGFLLRNFTDTNQIPVFRTESQHRMLHSALNFATGFFGLPLEGKYQQSITVEAPNFNNTLSPRKTCPNTGDPRKDGLSVAKVKQWVAIYLASARDRLGAQMKGYDLTVEDVYTMQQMCAYETVAIGYSKFCELFTEDEWEGFNYALDLTFWYDSAFGYPFAKPLGVGYVQELVARLTETPIAVHNSSTNATLNSNPVTFPLGQSLYVDATHEVVVLYVITALNLTSFAAGGPLPATHIPANRTFRSAELAPFATNLQFQLLSCDSVPDPQIRVIVNDGVVPLTGLRGCPEQKDGMCPVSTFVEAQKEIIGETDWEYGCHGDWMIPAGWDTTTGNPPKKADL